MKTLIYRGKKLSVVGGKNANGKVVVELWQSRKGKYDVLSKEGFTFPNNGEELLFACDIAKYGEDIVRAMVRQRIAIDTGQTICIDYCFCPILKLLDK